MQITRFGHACVLVEVASTRILIDPGAFSVDEAFELTGLDAIVVTHQHPDHLDVERVGGLIERNPDAVCLADPETVELLETGSWIVNVDGLETRLGEVSLTGVGAKHATILEALPSIANVGVLISAPEQPRFFHPGDSYDDVPPHVDVLALPLSAPWAKVAETVEFARSVAPGVLFPIHDKTISELAYGIYWGHVSRFSGVDDARLIGQTDSIDVE